MGLAVAAGIVAGIIGMLPLAIALRFSRMHPTTSVAASAVQGLVGCFISLIVLGVELFACSRLAHDVLVPFGVAEVIALILATSVYVMMSMRGKRNR